MGCSVSKKDVHFINEVKSISNSQLKTPNVQSQIKIQSQKDIFQSSQPFIKFPKGKSILLKRNEIKGNTDNDEPKEKIEFFITLRDENKIKPECNFSLALKNDEESELADLIKLGVTENTDTKNFIDNEYHFKTTFVIDYYLSSLVVFLGL